MTTIIKRVIYIAALILIAGGMLWYTDAVLKIKRSDGVTTIQGLYAQKENTVDVLLMGSSHAGMNLDTETLWSEYGIASYSPWGSVQPFWNSYYYLKEALKTQKPKAVVLDVYAATFQFEYSDDARQATNTVGMKLSRNKVEAVEASAPEERRISLLTGMPIYHTRYDELTQNDFLHFPWSKDQINNKGTSYRYGKGNFELEDATGVDIAVALYPKQEEYLRKFIELCLNEKITLLLVTTPTTDRIGEQPYYNYVQKIADEYGVEYYNFNLMDQETGFKAEDYWTDGHICTKGARKITSYLGKLIKEKCEVEDHRGDPEYESWNVNALNIRNGYLGTITDSVDYFDELSQTDKMVFIIKNSNWEEDEAYLQLLENFRKIGVEPEIVKNYSGGDWILTSTQNGELIDQYFGDMYSKFECRGASFIADFATGEGICVNGNKVYSLNGIGLICVVYDPETETCCDVVTFLQKDGFAMKRP